MEVSDDEEERGSVGASGHGAWWGAQGVDGGVLTLLTRRRRGFGWVVFCMPCRMLLWTLDINRGSLERLLGSWSWVMPSAVYLYPHPCRTQGRLRPSLQAFHLTE
jgi:hypothetical protein